MRTLKKLTFLLILILAFWSCKSDFLDAKPQKSLLIPTNLTDFEALLDNSNAIMNRAGYLSLAADGDLRINDDYLPLLDDPTRFSYAWSDQETLWVGDWDYAYRQVFYANVVLDGLDHLTGEFNETKANELRGRALFYRAWALHLMAGQFAGVYTKETAPSILGIPLPISPDVNQLKQRASLEETYKMIFNDLYQSLGLLPDLAAFVTQPSRASVYALLARLYLITGDYSKSLEVAEQTMKITNKLLDYNEINVSLARPFPLPAVNRNHEILYYSFGPTSFSANTNVYVDSSLYSLYQNNDLRKKVFFTEKLNYKGSYTGGTTPFLGLAMDEIYLIKAECLARQGEIDNALNTLNILRSNRYSKIGYTDIQETNRKELLQLIILERRRELVGRGTAWLDLRRLNNEVGFERTLKRMIANKLYILEPGDKRYIMKIPLDEIVGSGIEQNQ